MVQEGDLLKKGEYLLEGNPAPQDILTILGVEALADYLVNEIQKVYRLQGVPIDDKHIEGDRSPDAAKSRNYRLRLDDHARRRACRRARL